MNARTLALTLWLASSSIATATTAQAAVIDVDPDDARFAVDGQIDGTFDFFAFGRQVQLSNVDWRFAGEFDLLGISGVTNVELVFPDLTTSNFTTQEVRAVLYPSPDGVIALGDFAPAEPASNFVDFSVMPGQSVYAFDVTNGASALLESAPGLGVVLRARTPTGAAAALFPAEPAPPAQLRVTTADPVVVPNAAAAPTIDGVVGSAEWADAYKVDIRQGAAPVNLYWMIDGDELFVAVVDEGNAIFDGERVDLVFDDESIVAGGDPAALGDGAFEGSCPSDEGRIRFTIDAGQPQAEFSAFAAGMVTCRSQPLGGTTRFAFAAVDPGTITGQGAQFEAAIDLAAGPLQVAPGERFGAFVGVYDDDTGATTGANVSPEYATTALFFAPLAVPEPGASALGGLALVALAALRSGRVRR